MILHYDPTTALFLLECGYYENDFARRAGFAWNKDLRMWTTPFASTAAAFARTDKEKALVTKKAHDEKATFAASCATFSTFQPPAPEGLKYKDFQRAGLEFMQGKPSVLLADDMGLGKTIQAIGMYNLMTRGREARGADKISTLIVCPASPKRNWRREFMKWAVDAPQVGIAEGNTLPDTRVVVINYDIVARHIDRLKSRCWDMLILDECQYLKNTKAQRTQAIYGYRFTPGLRAGVKLALTGTPILNRPIELFSTLKFLQPEGWKDKHSFALRYCAAHQTRWGWDYNGAANMEELQRRLRSTIMLRRLKKDVLRELPPKQRQVIEIDPDAAGRKVLKKDRAMWGDILDRHPDSPLTEEEYRQVVRSMGSGGQVGFTEMSTVRRENGEAKVDMVIAHVNDCLESVQKVVIFAHHKSVISALAAEWGTACVVVDGSTANAKRDAHVTRFQTDPTCRVFIGEIIAAGTAITLTAASLVVFAELDWVPGNVTQCEDRCHRIGQNDNVMIHHLVLAGSIDALMAKTIVHKQDIIDVALNDNLENQMEEALK